MEHPIRVKDIYKALDCIVKGRLCGQRNGVSEINNPYVVMKSSNIPGKAIFEKPGLVYGDLEAEVKKIAVLMTLTEQAIELAGATSVDVLVAHHPIADAASSGGVLLKTYLDLYNISVFELHEAFHGLHPGMAHIHGHDPYRTETAYNGEMGKIFSIGETKKGIANLGDILDRVQAFVGWDEEKEWLDREKKKKKTVNIHETNVELKGSILVGNRDSPAKNILHIFPHTGFSKNDLKQVMEENPEIDTVLASISRVRKDHPLTETCRDYGLNFILGTSHAVEILENGIPLANSLKKRLPSIDVVVFREKMVSYSLDSIGTSKARHYGNEISADYLLDGEN